MPLLSVPNFYMANYIFNKPFGVLCQFSGEGQTLANYITTPNIYPAGRLDKDSEGLLILTDNGKFQHQISHPKFNKFKTYCVQVEGLIIDNALEKLRLGVVLKDGKTQPAKVKIIQTPDWLWCRAPPIRQRKNIPTSWVEIAICEGKNRQVRRMLAAVGFPVLRLIRIQIGEFKLMQLTPGDYERI
jgi:23S rRNA pseudouridine2457 synthase